MRKETKTKIAVIKEETAEQFERAVNSKVDELEGKSPTLEFVKEAGWCAYVLYQEEVEVLETAADRYQAMGIRLKCGQCPYRENPKEKRVRYTSCTLGDRQGIAYGDPACNLLYEMLEKGEVQL